MAKVLHLFKGMGIHTHLFFFFIFLLNSVKAESFSRSSNFQISGEGVQFGTPSGAPVKVKRDNEGNYSANFSVMKMLSSDNGETGSVLPKVIIPPLTDNLTDSDVFFQNVGEPKNQENRSDWRRQAP